MFFQLWRFSILKPGAAGPSVATFHSNLYATQLALKISDILFRYAYLADAELHWKLCNGCSSYLQWVKRRGYNKYDLFDDIGYGPGLMRKQAHEQRMSRKINHNAEIKLVII
jgi:hypothetical protein